MVSDRKLGLSWLSTRVSSRSPSQFVGPGPRTTRSWSRVQVTPLHPTTRKIGPVWVYTHVWTDQRSWCKRKGCSPFPGLSNLYWAGSIPCRTDLNVGFRFNVSTGPRTGSWTPEVTTLDTFRHLLPLSPFQIWSLSCPHDVVHSSGEDDRHEVRRSIETHFPVMT